MSTRERLPSLTGPDGQETWRTLGGDLLSSGEALALLDEGTVDVKGRLVSASNATLYAVVSSGGVTAACVYKPVAGERPLWDFPHGTLAAREVAAYRVSVAGGFDVVPPTVLRDGPFGPGSIQLWVEGPDGGAPVSPEDPDGAGLVDVVPADQVPAGWLTVLDAFGTSGEPVALVHAPDPRLATVATFDVLVNNADRKAGHLLVAPGDRVVGVDHGLTFHTEPKLRTVLWGFAGEPVAAGDVQRVHRLAAALDDDLDAPGLRDLLSASELNRLRSRTRGLLRDAVLPLPDTDRHVIPWPPF